MAKVSRLGNRAPKRLDDKSQIGGIELKDPFDEAKARVQKFADGKLTPPVEDELAKSMARLSGISLNAATRQIPGIMANDALGNDVGMRAVISVVDKIPDADGIPKVMEYISDAAYDGFFKEPDEIISFGTLLGMVPPDNRKHFLERMAANKPKGGWAEASQDVTEKVVQTSDLADKLPEHKHEIWYAGLYSLTKDKAALDEVIDHAVVGGMTDEAAAKVPKLIDMESLGSSPVKNPYYIMMKMAAWDVGDARERLSGFKDNFNGVPRMTEALFTGIVAADPHTMQYAESFYQDNETEIRDRTANAKPFALSALLGKDKAAAAKALVGPMEGSRLADEGHAYLERAYLASFVLVNTQSGAVSDIAAKALTDGLETTGGPKDENKEIRHMCIDAAAIAYQKGIPGVKQKLRPTLAKISAKVGIDFIELAEDCAHNDRKDQLTMGSEGEILARSLKVLDELSKSEKTKDAARYMRDKHNIRIYGRYTAKTLATIHGREAKKAKTEYSGLIVYPQDDHNGAFMNDADKIERLVVDLGADLHEAGNMFGLGRALIRHEANYGALDYMILGGHGNQDGVQIGDARVTQQHHLTRAHLMDMKSLKRPDGKKLDRLFKRRFQGILVSCSTGKVIEGEAAPIADDLTMVLLGEGTEAAGRVASITAPGEDSRVSSIDWKTEPALDISIEYWRDGAAQTFRGATLPPSKSQKPP